MSKMKVNDFIEKLKEVEKKPTLYELGTFLNSKQGQYLLSDCSGLIKGILWGYPEKGKYASNGVPDINANMLISKCSNISTNFNKISVGEMVWLDGHCGVYIGNGNVIESSPKWENGVQVTALTDRNWLKHGKLPYIDYSSEKEDQEKIEDLDSAIEVVAKEVIKGTYGNGHETRENAIYSDVRNLVNGKTITRKGDLLSALKVIANYVKIGYFGNGHEKRSQAIYTLVRDKVNELA